MVVVFYEKMLKRVLVCLLSFMVFSCAVDKQESEKGFGLKKTKFSELKQWNDDNLFLFDKTIKYVCEKIEDSASETLKSDVFEFSLIEYKKHCKKINKLSSALEIKKYIEKNFEPYLVVYNGDDRGKFTSYYEAEIRASYKRDNKYKFPIYGKPNDLVEVNLREFNEKLPNERLVGRVENGKLVKYYTRDDIEVKGVDAPVVLWGDNLVDIYIMQIQGSAVATLPSGKEVRVGYADNNGHSFRGIGSILLEKGFIKPKNASMSKIRKWLNKNGKKALDSMRLNNRYIFHKIVDAEGPIGALGVPLFAGRGVAVDKTYIPLGTILWLETRGPLGDINKLVVAEDVGSAIKGPIRGDYFWGHGEDALEYAGQMNSMGRYFVVLPKDSKVSVYGR